MKFLVSAIVLLCSLPLLAGGSIGGSTGGAAMKEHLDVMETIILEPSIVEDLKSRLTIEKSVPLQIDNHVYFMQKIESRIVDESLTLEVVSE